MPAQRSLSQARKTQILKAAVETISQRGLCETRIADVAAKAGTSAGLLIYYFGSKDRLLAEALAHSEEQFYAQTERELAALPTATERLVRLFELSCSVGAAKGARWLDEWVLWLDLWARAPRDPDVAKDRETMDRRFRDAIAGIVRAGQEAGEFSSLDADEFALRTAALIDGLAIQVVLGDPDVSAERMFDLCLRTATSDLGFEWPPSGAAGARRSTRGRTGPRSTARGPARAAGGRR